MSNEPRREQRYRTVGQCRGTASSVTFTHDLPRGGDDHDRTAATKVRLLYTVELETECGECSRSRTAAMV